MSLQSRFPLGAQLRLAQLDLDPYPTLAELREHEPVSWVPETEMFFVTRRDDVLRVLRDARTFTTDAPSSTIRDIFGVHMMTTDGEVALRYKRACLHAFQASSVEEEMGGWVRDEATRLVVALKEERPFDLIGTVATPLAIGSVLRMLGLSEELAGRMHEWYDDFALALANFKRDPAVRRRGKAAAAAFDAEVRPRLAALAPGDRGLLARLATRQRDPLTPDEIISNALIILFGGIETTESMIANTVWSLLVTGSWEAVRADPESRGPAIEECLRWQPSVQSITRHTTAGVNLRGVSIPPGSVIQCMIGGANRDPRHFHDPDAFDLNRPNAADHLAFGTGRHLCLGAHLARLEIRAVLEAVADRFTALDFERGRTAPMRGHEFRRPQRLELLGSDRTIRH